MKNSKVVSFLSPFRVGQAGNLWTLPRTYSACLLLFASILYFRFKLNLIAMSLFCFVTLDFVPFSVIFLPVLSL